METQSAEFQDWELLQPNSASSDSELATTNSNAAFAEIGHETEGLIQANYFSIDSHRTEKGSEELDNPNWIDSGSETGGFISGSGSERSDDKKFGEFEGEAEVSDVENEKFQGGFGITEEMGSENAVKFGEFEGKNEVGVVESSELQVGFGGIEDMGSQNAMKFGEFVGKNEVGGVENSGLQLGFEGIEEMGSESGKNLEGYWSDSGGIGDFEGRSEVCAEEKEESERVEREKRDEIVEVEASKAGKENKRSVVWWQVPLELLKYCVFRVRPMWAFSMAAAVMGFVILGRRLYKMKKKTKGLELKVTVDDKKVSQFMSRAARLNEAFSVVKRVPVIRPQLPAPGASLWPVVNMR